MTPLPDYYEILQVSPKAEQAVIEAAYRKLASIYHPDVNKAPDATGKFQQINEAHEVLGNPQKREAYDWGLKQGLHPADESISAYGNEPASAGPSSYICPVCRLGDKTRLYIHVIEERRYLRQRYSFPPQPVPPKIKHPGPYPKNMGWVKLWGGILTDSLCMLLILFAILSSMPAGDQQGNAFLLYIPLMIAFLLGFKLILDGRKETSPEAIQHQQQLYIESLNAYQRQVDTFTRQMENWEHARENWLKLYYCFRDDVAFIPGSHKASAIQKLDDYLFMD